MSSELRITVEEVRAAYEKTGIQPIQCLYIDHERKNNCGCPLTALYFSETGADLSCFKDSSDDIPEWADKKYGSLYHHAFVRGVDGLPNSGIAERIRQGWEDGCKIGRVVFRDEE